MNDNKIKSSMPLILHEADTLIEKYSIKVTKKKKKSKSKSPKEKCKEKIIVKTTATTTSSSKKSVKDKYLKMSPEKEKLNSMDSDKINRSDKTENSEFNKELIIIKSLKINKENSPYIDGSSKELLSLNQDKNSSNLKLIKVSQQSNYEGGRRDFRGNLIVKGKNKKHHITFKDYIGMCNLVEYVNIPKECESRDISKSSKDDESGKNSDSSVSCTCLIF